MNITDSGTYIRQHQPGQFGNMKKGQKPIAHVNSVGISYGALDPALTSGKIPNSTSPCFHTEVKGQKLESSVNKKGPSVYIGNEQAVALEKDYQTSATLFDFDAGLSFSNEKRAELDKYGGFDSAEENREESKNMRNQESFVDQWA